MQDRRGETGHLAGKPGIAVQWVAVTGESVDQGLVIARRQGDPRVGFAVGELRGRRALTGLSTEPAITADHQRGQRLGDLGTGSRIGAAGTQDEDGVLTRALVLDIRDLGHHR